MGTTNNNMSAAEYIQYWDEIIRKWAANGEIPATEQCWFPDGNNLHKKLLPTPYWGDPCNCSAVLLNYNPGGPAIEPPAPYDEFDPNHRAQHIDRKNDPDSLTGAMCESYSKQAIEFPWINPEPPYNSEALAPSRRWLQCRAKWLERRAGNTGKRPFLMEVCAWHSYKWKRSRFTPEQTEYIKRCVLPVFREAVGNSDLKIGFVVGKMLGDRVFADFGFDNITGQLGLDTAGGDRWQPLKDKRRWYRAFSDGNICVINTWSSGSNKCPAEHFGEAEQKLNRKRICCG